MNQLNYSLGVVEIIVFLISLIPLAITIGLIIAIFQINSRIDDIKRVQQIAAARQVEAAELQLQAFIAQLASEGPNHKAYLDYLVAQGTLTQDQADFIQLQSDKQPAS